MTSESVLSTMYGLGTLILIAAPAVIHDFLLIFVNKTDFNISVSSFQTTFGIPMKVYQAKLIDYFLAVFAVWPIHQIIVIFAVIARILDRSCGNIHRQLEEIAFTK